MDIKFDINKLYIVADFDHTLTTKDSQNCWGIISKIPNISKEYIKKSKQNNDYYLPIEQDNTLDLKAKQTLMRAWYQDHLKMLIKYKVTKQDIENISQSDDIIFRNGLPEFLDFTYKNNIPFIIVSAGITNIIKGALKKRNLFYDNIYILSNILKFKDDYVINTRNNIIHSLNKNIVEVPPKIKELLKDRNQVILIGDNIGDALMMIKKNDKTFKVAFINYPNKENLVSFKKCFDVVLGTNQSFDDVKKLLEANLQK